VPAAIVAAMCAAIGADVGTGLQLAGHEPAAHPQLVASPPIFSVLARRPAPFIGPYIATPHVVAAALADVSTPGRGRMSGVYRALAESNEQVAERLSRQPPDARAEYWAGYAAAIRAVAEQQAVAADTVAAGGAG
jgi:hypothetical protein